jgi:hypothetical protein
LPSTSISSPSLKPEFEIGIKHIGNSIKDNIVGNYVLIIY